MSVRMLLVSLMTSGLVVLGACSGGGGGGGGGGTGLEGTWSIQGTPVAQTGVACTAFGLESFTATFTALPTEGDNPLYAGNSADLEPPPSSVATLALAIGWLKEIADLGDRVSITGLYYHPPADVTVTLTWPLNANLESFLAADLSAFDSVVEFECFAGYQIMAFDEDGDGMPSWWVAEDAVRICSGLYRLEAQRTSGAAPARVDEASAQGAGAWQVAGLEAPLAVHTRADFESGMGVLALAIPEEHLPGVGRIELPFGPAAREVRVELERAGRALRVELTHLRARGTALTGVLSVADLDLGRVLAGPLRVRP